LEKELALYALLVNCFNLHGLPTHQKKVEIVVIRENTRVSTQASNTKCSGVDKSIKEVVAATLSFNSATMHRTTPPTAKVTPAEPKMTNAPLFMHFATKPIYLHVNSHHATALPYTSSPSPQSSKNL